MNEQELNEGKLMDFLIRVFSGKKVPTMSEKLMDLVTQKMAHDKEFDDLIRNGTTANGFKSGYREKFIKYVKKNMDPKLARDVLGDSSVEKRIAGGNLETARNLKRLSDEEKIAANLTMLSNKMATAVSRHARRTGAKKMNENITDFISAVVADKPHAALNAFSEVISEKVSEALDSKYIEVAQTMFNVNEAKVMKKKMNVGKLEVEMEIYADGSGEIDISDEDGVIYSEDSGNVKTWISSIEKMMKKKDMAMFAGDLKKVVAALKKVKITEESEDLEEISQKLATKAYAWGSADEYEGNDDQKTVSRNMRLRDRIKKKYGKKAAKHADRAAHAAIFGRKGAGGMPSVK